jgi:hypothetical protein
VEVEVVEAPSILSTRVIGMPRMVVQSAVMGSNWNMVKGLLEEEMMHNCGTVILRGKKAS